MKLLIISFFASFIFVTNQSHAWPNHLGNCRITIEYQYQDGLRETQNFDSHVNNKKTCENRSKTFQFKDKELKKKTVKFEYREAGFTK
jgi:hypothetical protein